jgi:hypothetical protein
MDLLGSRSLRLINTIKDLDSVKPPKIIEDSDIKRIDDATKALQRLKIEAQAGVAPAVGFWASIMRAGISGVSGFINKDGGIAGPNGRLAAGVAAYEESIRGNVKDIVSGIGSFGTGGAADAISEILGKILGVPKEKQLWREGQVTAMKPGDQFTSGFTPSTSATTDQFQRIGAFTGSAGQAAQMDVARKSLTALEQLRADLVRRGILVRTE